MPELPDVVWGGGFDAGMYLESMPWNGSCAEAAVLGAGVGEGGVDLLAPHLRSGPCGPRWRARFVGS